MHFEVLMKNILIVDDDVDYLNLMDEMIQGEGHYITYRASDGVEAEALLQNHAIDLVVTDVYMPEKDGLELILDLRGQGIPVIVMSGGGQFGSYDYLEPAKKFGACAVLKKPFLKKDLLDALSSALGA